LPRERSGSSGSSGGSSSSSGGSGSRWRVGSLFALLFGAHHSH
jgi:hypothetical protein